jgi:hypothetical protein
LRAACIALLIGFALQYWRKEFWPHGYEVESHCVSWQLCYFQFHSELIGLSYISRRYYIYTMRGVTVKFPEYLLKAVFNYLHTNGCCHLRSSLLAHQYA